jgi:hypothetical protein
MLYFASFIESYSNPVQLSNSALSGTSLGMHLEILTDKTAQMTIQDVARAAQADWKPSPSLTPSFGFTDAAYWQWIGCWKSHIQ